MADRVRDGMFAAPDRATPWPCFSEWLRHILPDRWCGVLGRRAMTLRGVDGEVTIRMLLFDDVSSFLDCSGCRMLMLGSVPEG